MPQPRHKAIAAGLALTLTFGSLAVPALATTSDTHAADDAAAADGLPAPSDFDRADEFASGEAEAGSTARDVMLARSVSGLSDEMKYFSKYESSCNYDQGFSYGDGYNAMGYYQFDRRYSLVPFIESVYKHNPSKYSMFAAVVKRGDELKSGKIYDSSSKRLTEIGQLAEDAWHAAYAKDPAEFAALQDAYSYNNYYLPIERSLRNSYQVEISDRADCVKGLVWGMCNLFGQGGVQKFFKAANLSDSMTDREMVNALCDAVIAHYSTGAGTDNQYAGSYVRRYRSEREVCLKYISVHEAEQEGSGNGNGSGSTDGDTGNGGSGSGGSGSTDGGAGNGGTDGGTDDGAGNGNAGDGNGDAGSGNGDAGNGGGSGNDSGNGGATNPGGDSDNDGGAGNDGGNSGDSDNDGVGGSTGGSDSDSGNAGGSDGNSNGGSGSGDAPNNDTPGAGDSAGGERPNGGSTDEVPTDKVTTHTVIFDDCDKSTNNATFSIEQGTTFSALHALPSDPTSSGHNFVGWYHYDPQTKEYGEKFDPDAPVTGDLYLAAKWEPKTFGGAADPETDIESDDVDANGSKGEAAYNGLPKTSDASAVAMMVAAAMSATGTAALAFGGKVREDEE